MNDITAIVLTKNEEINIARCLRALDGLADRIIVVDSGSTDRTVDLAREHGAEVVFHEFKHYAGQFNWALDNVGIGTKWVLRVDADEVITEELKREIQSECQNHQTDDVNGFLLAYKTFFLGRFLTHGGVYPFIKMSVFKPGFGRFEERSMGEHIALSSGRTIRLKNDCLHYDCKSLTAFIAKHNSYASREVQDYILRGSSEVQGARLYARADLTGKLRDKVYYKLPKFLRAKLYYWYRYYVQLGFLDGTPGRVYALLQAYFYRYIVDAKLYEYEISEKGE